MDDPADQHRNTVRVAGYVDSSSMRRRSRLVVVHMTMAAVVLVNSVASMDVDGNLVGVPYVRLVGR